MIAEWRHGVRCHRWQLGSPTRRAHRRERHGAITGAEVVAGSKVRPFAIDEGIIVTHDVPNGPQPTTPNGPRTKIVLAALIIAVAAAVLVGVLAMNSGSDDQPATPPGGGALAENETTQNFFFMAHGDESFARLDMVVGPQGQISGTHVFVRFGDDGDPYTVEEQFGGTFTDGAFELTGLSDTRSAYLGTLENGTLTLNGTFGVSSKEWEQISAADAEEAAAEFDQKVGEFTPEPFECEDEGRFGCGEN
ncbi:hypothetical protein ABZ639_19630 [Saccharomonospora sp. NPDC006951]